MCLKLSTSGRMEESDIYPNLFKQNSEIIVPTETISLLALEFPTTVYCTHHLGKVHGNRTHNQV